MNQLTATDLRAALRWYLQHVRKLSVEDVDALVADAMRKLRVAGAGGGDSITVARAVELYGGGQVIVGDTRSPR